MYSSSELNKQLYFFYGTLRDPEVLGLVLKNECHPSLVREAKLLGHVLKNAVGEDFPIIETSDRLDDFALGALYCGINEDGRRRLIYFEGEEYDLKSVKIDNVDVMCFFPSDLSYEAQGSWSFDNWRSQEHKYQTYLAQVADYMAHFGLDSDFVWKSENK